MVEVTPKAAVINQPNKGERLELNLGDQVVNKDEAVVTPPENPPADITQSGSGDNTPDLLNDMSIQAFKDKTPANWNITALSNEEELSEEQIEARNSVTNESFTGTIKQFSAALRD